MKPIEKLRLHARRWDDQPQDVPQDDLERATSERLITGRTARKGPEPERHLTVREKRELFEGFER